MTVKRMDNVGIVVESLDAVVPFLTPPVVADHRNAPVNALGYLRVMFAVDDMDDTLTRPPRAWRAARRRSGSVRRCVSALLHPRPRRTAHRPRRGARVS